MENLVTVATFTLPSELLVIRGLLESENIECFVKDELTAQVHNFYSNAIGGIKLQVKAIDKDRAIVILKETGYIKEDTSPSFNFLEKFEATSSKIPLINKINLLPRLIVVLSSLILLITVPLVIISQPTDYEALINNSWCVSHISYKGSNYRPNTDSSFKIFGDDFCNEYIRLDKFRNEISFPGFKSDRPKGKWEYLNDTLYVTSVDTFGYFLNGKYLIEYSNNKLKLTSNQTEIHCFKTKY